MGAIDGKEAAVADHLLNLSLQMNRSIILSKYIYSDEQHAVLF